MRDPAAERKQPSPHWPHWRNEVPADPSRERLGEVTTKWPPAQRSDVGAGMSIEPTDCGEA
jgi:hypothetical protein